MGNNRIQFLDGFRFLLALWVLIAHYYTFIGGSRYFVLPKFLNDSLNKPVIAVYGFMIITGFLMTYNYIAREQKEPYDDSTTFRSFWLRRLFRLYPVYILAIAVAFITFVPCANINRENLIFFTGSDVSQWGTVRSLVQPSGADLLSHVFLIHGLIPQFSDSLLGVAWSLSLEMQFYFIFPFLFLAVFSRTPILKNRLFFTLVFYAVLAVINPKLIEFITSRNQLIKFGLPSILLYVMPFFLLGMVAAGVKLRKINPIYLTVAFFVILPFQWIATNLVIGTLLLLLFLDELQGIMPGYMYKTIQIFRSAMSGRLATFGADISYSMYLIHTMIIGISIQLVIRTMPSLQSSKIAVAAAGLVITLVISIALGYLIFQFIEKPMIAIGKRIIKSQNKAKPQVAEAVV